MTTDRIGIYNIENLINSIMIADKAKAITCVIFSMLGWLVLFGGIIYDNTAPINDDFAMLHNFFVFLVCAIVASAIELASAILSTVFFMQKNRYKKTCIFIMLNMIGVSEKPLF